MNEDDVFSSNDDVNDGCDIIEAIYALPRLIKQVSNVIKETVSNVKKLASILSTFNIDDFVDKYSNQEKTIENGVLVWGYSGWCMYGVDYENPAMLCLLNEICEEAKINDKEYDSKKLNELAIDYLEMDNAIDRTITNLELNLIPTDKEKFLLAMQEYNDNKYHNCAMVLCSIIDSLSIKQVIDDIENKRYISDDKKYYITQGWQAFWRVYKDNIEPILGEIPKKPEFEDISEKLKTKQMKLKELYYLSAIANILICIRQIFSNFKFEKYKEKKPDIINRNWLAHGMYNINDITKTDCIKLILILSQLLKLYERISNNEL